MSPACPYPLDDVISGRLLTRVDVGGLMIPASAQNELAIHLFGARHLVEDARRFYWRGELPARAGK